MKKKLIPVCEPTLEGNELKYVVDCIKTKWISSSGKYIEEFEKKFASYCGAKHGVAVCNGTVSIHLALEAMGIGKGDEVIVPDFTMVASVNAILYTGAKPVFIDADIDTWCMDPSLIESKITKRTKAIMPVHIYGHPCNMDPINTIAKKHKLLVLEDAAEAHGAFYKGRKIGSLGDAASFSFYANKIITTGEGGMIITNSRKVAERAKLLRNHAFTKRRFFHDDIGFNYRMTNVQAAIGVAQMEYADELCAARIKNARAYSRLLKDVKGIVLPPEKKWAKNVYWMYGILISKEFGMTRDELRDELQKNGIETRDFFAPMHRQRAFAKKEVRNYAYPDVKGEYPVSDYLGKNGLYLPSSGKLPKKDLLYVVNTIKKLQKEVNMSHGKK